MNYKQLLENIDHIREMCISNESEERIINELIEEYYNELTNNEMIKAKYDFYKEIMKDKVRD